jgi:predicted NAD/FAD-binding protein
VRLATLLWRDARLRRPGFAGLSHEYAAPFSEWARGRRLSGVAALIEPWFTGFGYGYLDEVPAALVLKYVSLFRFPVCELLDVGYQGLWERVAASLDVRLGTRIRAVARDRDEVTVALENGGAEEHLRFAALIVTCPPDEALALLDVDAEERELLSRPVFNDYRVIAAVVDGAPRARYGFIHRHLRRDHAGEVLFWYRRWLDRDLVLYYSLPSPGTPLDETEARVRDTVARMGGRVVRVHTRHTWRYSPHVDAAAMRAGYFERVEALQGRRRTYFAGELLAFSTVETVVGYARDLVARHLAPAASR